MNTPTKRKLGLRGEVLLYVGFLWCLYGFAVSQTPIPERALALHEELPVAWRVAGWTVTGGVAIFFAFRRWPGRDRWGFGALLVMPAERVISWVVTPLAAALGFLPASPPLILCVSNAIVWSVVALLIYRIGASRQLLIINQGETQVAQGDLAELSPQEAQKPPPDQTVEGDQ